MMLAPHHERLLTASAIAPAVTEARGYRTVLEVSELRTLRFAKTCGAPGLLIPIHGVDGLVRTHQYRPDHPRLDSKGRPRKYEFPWQSRQVLDVPPAVRASLGDPSVALWITEGARKADAAVSVGIACISVSGVWNWRGTNDAGGRTVLPDWDHVALNGRAVCLCFDSDAATNPNVALALARFTGFLEFRGATVTPITLPSEHGEKVGLDDYLAGHGLDELLRLRTREKPIAPDESVLLPPPRPAAPARTLADVEATFRRWIPDEDPIPTRVVLATYVANRKLDGDPVWMMLVGGSGVGKTERLTPIAVMSDVVLASSITGPAALLSGTGLKERAKDASGGLLRRIPAGGGVLVLKDFTSIIDMHRDARAEVLAALREVYDGRWDRHVGAEGGRTLTWTGHLGLLAGCTTAIDSANSVISVMGTRFLLVRLRGNQDIAGSAFDHAGQESPMRDELREAVRGLLEHLPGTPYDKTEVREAIIALASYAALARSPVDRDQRSEIRLVLDPEAPTRIVKMLVQLWRAAGLLGLDKASAWAMVRRVGVDSVPKLRRAILDYLERCSKAIPTTTDIAEAVEHPQQTTRRALEDLAAHRVVIRTAGGAGKADRWELASQTRAWLAMTLPVLSGHTHAPAAAQSVPSIRSKITNDDKTGKVDQVIRFAGADAGKQAVQTCCEARPPSASLQTLPAVADVLATTGCRGNAMIELPASRRRSFPALMDLGRTIHGYTSFGGAAKAQRWLGR